MTRTHYTSVAVLLHWAIAIAIILMIPLGLWMHHAIEEPETQAQALAAYQLHKSVGLTILVLSIFRLGWRLLNPPPPLPAASPWWEKMAALAVHWLFYFLIIAIPLTGWIYVSAQWREDGPFNVPTLWFGLFNVPHLFGLSHAPFETRESVADVSMEAHELMAKATIGLIALHVAAALKHQIYDRDEVLGHMVPGINPAAPDDRRRRFVLLGGFAAIAVAAATGIFAFFSPGITPNTDQSLFAQEQARDYALPQDYAAPPAQAPQTETQQAPLPNVGVMGNPPAPPAPRDPSAGPPRWNVNRSASEIAFSGRHAAVNFRGTFETWRADIRFDPENLDASQVTVTIDTASARDGVSLHEQSLPQREWFDTANHPQATFRTTRIRHREGNEYEAEGMLTIKGRTEEIDLPFTLTINANRASMTGRVEIERRDFDLGMESDPDAEYVSRSIRIEVRVEATREQ
ncbi:MAG: YceI family protein [Hyphomonadaceae bacterium]